MKIKPVPTIAFLCLLPILLGLGLWQLDRAAEKRNLIERQNQQRFSDTFILTSPILAFSETLLYQPVQVTGHYDNEHQFLLDNQMDKGRAGFFVLTPFVLKESNTAVLVNRGWLPLGVHRTDLPEINVETKELTVNGRINRFPRPGLTLPNAEIPTNGWPAVIQVIDNKILSKHLNYSLTDFQIELDNTAEHGYKREWHEAQVMSPEKHVGYAVQWFLLALTLIVLFVKYGINKND